ncbi:MAG: hypothetical protein AB1689_12270 [Thermodesulfobacteriota bacterium]
MVAPRLVAELNASLPGAVRRADTLLHGAREERLPTGFAELDAALDGGLPRGHLSELVAHGSAGATSLVQRLLGRLTAQAHVAAWVDAPDAFDPASASAAGIDLERLLWVRPPDLATALAATEALLTMGGFPLVLLDAAAAPRGASARMDVPRRAGLPGRAAPAGSRVAGALHAWIRLARAAARSRSALLVLQHAPHRTAAGRDGQPAGAGSAAAVRLEIEPLRVVWDRADGAPSLLDGLVAQVVVRRNRGGDGSERRILLEVA